MAVVVSALRAVWSRGRSANYNNGNTFCSTTTDGSATNYTATYSGAVLAGRGRPKEDRELRKRVSLSVLPSLYEDIQKIAYVERRSVSELLSDLMVQYRDQQKSVLSEYEKVRK